MNINLDDDDDYLPYSKANRATIAVSLKLCYVETVCYSPSIYVGHSSGSGCETFTSIFHLAADKWTTLADHLPDRLFTVQLYSIPRFLFILLPAAILKCIFYNHTRLMSIVRKTIVVTLFSWISYYFCIFLFSLWRRTKNIIVICYVLLIYLYWEFPKGITTITYEVPGIVGLFLYVFLAQTIRPIF